MSIEELLAQMCDYGRPRLCCSDDGTWHCSMKMLVTGAGINFEITSGFNFATPRLAAQECYDRMMGALNSVASQKQIGVAK